MQKDNKHTKKYIAPVIVTIIMLIYCAFYAAMWIYIPKLTIFKVVGACIALFLAGMSIYVFVERIREIRSGEEDDLSKY